MPPPLPPLLLLTLLPLPSPSPPAPSPLRRGGVAKPAVGVSSSQGAELPRDSPSPPHHVIPPVGVSSSSSSSSSSSAPPPPELCHGYYDVMGHYDAAFNCSTGAFRFCCGTCSYRFCCEHRGRRLEQRRCTTNLRTPPWARTAAPRHAPPGHPPSPPGGHGDPRAALAAGGAGGAGGVPYVVCGVVSVALAVAVGARAVWGRGRGARGGDRGDGSRALVDVLRHQAGGGGARPERRSSCGVLPAPPPEPGPPRPPKNIYEGGYAHLGFGTPEHRGSALDWRVPPPAPLSCSRSFHNLSHPPPPYESPPRADGARWASLRRLADRDLEDFGGPWGPPWGAAPPPPRGTLPLPPARGRRVLSQEFLGGGGGVSGGVSGGGTLPRNRPRTRPPLSHAASQSSLGGGAALGAGPGALGAGPGGGPGVLGAGPGAPFSPPPGGAPGRRAMFGGQRQNTAELQLLPGPPPGPPPAPPPHRLRTGSRTEVTV